MFKYLWVCALAGLSWPAFAGSFVAADLPLTMTLEFDWSGVVQGNTTFALANDGSVWNPTITPWSADNRMVCASFDICVDDGSFLTGNSGEGTYFTRGRRIESSCAVDNTATAPTGNFWYWVAVFAPGITLEPTRCTVRQFMHLGYFSTTAVYEGTAELGSVVFWRARNGGGNVVGTVPVLTDAVTTGGTYSGALSGPGTGTFSEL